MSEKGKRVMQWVLVILIAFQFLMLGFSKLNNDMLHTFESWGYSSDFMYLVGLLEILSAIGLFFNKSRVISCLALIAIMVGAAVTHWLHNQHFEILINVGVIGFCTIILWLEQERYLSTLDNINSAG